MAWDLEKDPEFDRAIRELRKKYRNAESDILDEISDGPPSKTDPIPTFEKKLWKGRAASTDMARGKSGGFRIIYYWDEAAPNWAYLCTCYAKPQFENLPSSELARLFAKVAQRIRDIEQAKKKEAENRPPAADDPIPEDAAS